MHKLNIVVVGKAGVGKSSLLNYLVNKQIFETGAGAPVTQDYFEEHTYYDSKTSVSYSLFDTKGIEPDTLEEFSSNISQQLSNKSKSTDFGSHFHALYYCISAAGKRIEPFETEFIKKMSFAIDVVIVLTKCDLVSKDAIEALHELLEMEVGASSKNVESTIRITNVCNVKKVTRIGVSEAFGRREILDHSFVGMWNTFTRSKEKEIKTFFNFFESTWSRKQFFIDQKIEDVETQQLILLQDLETSGFTPTVTFDVWEKFKKNWVQKDSKVFTVENLNHMPYFLIFKLPAFNSLNLSLGKKESRLILLHYLGTIRQLIIKLQRTTFLTTYEENLKTQIDEVLNFYKVIVGEKLEVVPLVRSKQKLSQIRKLIETEIPNSLSTLVDRLILTIYNYEKFSIWQTITRNNAIEELFLNLNNLLSEKGKMLDQLCTSYKEITNTELHQYGKLMLNKHINRSNSELDENEEKYIEDYIFYYEDGNNIDEIKRYFLERKRVKLGLSKEAADELEKLGDLSIENI